MFIRQINLNKSKIASANFCHYLTKDDFNTIYLITETYLYKNKIPGLSHLYTIYGTHESGRAIIIAPKIFPLFLHSEFNDRDHTVVLFNDGKHSCYFASIYLDINLPSVSPMLVKMCDFFTDNNSNSIFGADSNAHSVLWSCEENNQRGSLLEEHIFGYNMHILNRGSDPTFVSTRFKSIIDISLCMGDIVHKIHSWHVKKEHFFTDHKMIQFEVNFSKLEKPTVKMTNWQGFKEALSKMKNCFYDVWTNDLVDSEAEFLTTALHKALQHSTFEAPIKAKTAKWWNAELQSQKLHCKKLFQKFNTVPTEENKDAYFSAKDAFRRAIKREKRKSWKNFCTSIKDPKNMAFLIKILKGSSSEKLGLLRKNGVFTKTPLESVNYLMSQHFPGSVRLKNRQIGPGLGGGHVNMPPPPNILAPKLVNPNNTHVNSNVPMNNIMPPMANFCTKERLSQSFITEETVKLAINSFGPDKSGGCDGFKPRVLQNLPDTVYTRLTNLYRAIVELGYTPRIWRESRVVFIPKPGKTDYTDVRAWRPISLSTFLIKTVEKLILWELKTSCSIDTKMSKDQHAFRKGYSCETALSDFIDDIESSILRGKLGLAVFLDIRGAFDNVPHTAIIQSMKAKNLPDKIVNWYEQYLTSRTAHAEIQGYKCSVLVKKGAPQGGILSPILGWNLVFESFISAMDCGPVKTRCFADDAGLLIKGICPTTMVYLMQNALNRAIRWGDKHFLEFVPAKTSAMFFHRKKKFKEPKPLHVKNVPVAYKTVTKYLGIFVDQGLHFSHHVQTKISQAKKLVMTIRNAITSNFGPRPSMMKWAFNGIVLPMLSYGSIIFARACKSVGTRAKLTKLNRLMALTMMPVRRSTPTSGLEVILGLPPIDLKIEELALKAMLRVLPHNRTRWDGLGTSSNGHLRHGLDKLRSLGIHSTAFDKTSALNLNKRYAVDLDSFKSGLPISDTSTTVFTDGSKMTANAGYGFGIIEGSEITASGNGQMASNNSVFQAEVLAIHKACETLYEMDSTTEVTIFSDSQAAIQAIASHTIKSKVVENCVNQINTLAGVRSVKIKWVKSHKYTLNEFADQQAKIGTTNHRNKVDVSPPESWAKHIIASSIMKDWTNRWLTLKEARQTKLWIAKPDKALSGLITNLDRSGLGLIVQMITGHNRLKRHEHIVNGTGDPYCRYCGNEAEETSFHLIAECPALWLRRRDSFNSFFLDNPPKWRLKQLLKFLKLSRMEEINQGNTLVTP